VDIGAGTSDIAITKSGTVIAYAMVPIAGDELTETIAQHYLVDFNMAERIKLALGEDQDTIEFVDILDNKVTVKPDEVAEVIRPSVDELAKTITGKILEYNGGKAPNAVFLVGAEARPGAFRKHWPTISVFPRKELQCVTAALRKMWLLTRTA
jgi:cell division ATPase FtsA